MFKKQIRQLEKQIIRISGADDTPAAFSFAGFLNAVSVVYAMGTRARFFLYKIGIKRAGKLPCFVMSVGNIVAGGTGKTPFSLYLAKMIQQMEQRAVIVSRGYGGDFSEDVLVVSDGEKIFCSAKVAGDEPVMMARAGRVPVVVGKNRYLAGRKAMELFSPDVIILDDGFQHLRLKKDLELLLLDFSKPLGNRKMLPAGRLRENAAGGIKRADAVIFTRCSPRELDTDELPSELPVPLDCPWFKTIHEPFISFIKYRDCVPAGETGSIENLEGRTAVMFSGIAQNDSFYRIMTRFGVNILEHLEFKDHYRYKKADILKINRMAREKGADIILTTHKDWVKLPPDVTWETDITVVDILIRFAKEESFKTFIQQKLNFHA